MLCLLRYYVYHSLPEMCISHPLEKKHVFCRIMALSNLMIVARWDMDCNRKSEEAEYVGKDTQLVRAV